MKKILTLTLLTSTAAVAQPELNLDLSKITVSGLSSGGYMASQFHVAHSDWVEGAAIIAAGPYYCGQNSLMTALGNCVNKRKDSTDLSAIAAKLDTWQKSSSVADLQNLKGDKVWILHGKKDAKVIATATEDLVKQYQKWSGKDNVVYVNDQPFGHHMPTQSTGSDCAKSESPFLGNCGYDAAGKALSHLQIAKHNPSTEAQGKLTKIDQQKLAGEHKDTLADQGFIYIPENCAAGQSCKVHVSFHGCNQAIGAVGDAYAKNAGFNRWADTNNLVVVYPQTKASKLMPLNPQGCWDWWGYTDENYATKNGQQVQAVTAIIKALGEK